MQLYNEEWELIADGLTTEQRPSRGGGKKKRGKSRTPARSGAISQQNSEKSREAEHYHRIRSFLPKRFFKPKLERLYLPGYEEWVGKSLIVGKAVINGTDVGYKAKRAQGAGGQNVNKNSSVPVYTHFPTGLQSESSKTPDLERNKGYAQDIMKTKLEDHIEDWVNLAELKGVDLKDPIKVSEFISETFEIIKKERGK